MLSRDLDASGRESGVVLRVHSARRQPPGEGKTFLTYTARIGYALPDEGRNRTRLDAGQPSTNVVPDEVSINEPIGADADVAVGDRSLRVSTPDGIVAEKLRAFCSRKGRSATGTGSKTPWTCRPPRSRQNLPVPAAEGPSQGRAPLQNRFSEPRARRAVALRLRRPEGDRSRFIYL